MTCTHCGKQHPWMNADACRYFKTPIAELKARAARTNPTALARVDGPPSLIDEIRRDRGVEPAAPSSAVNSSTGVVQPPSMTDALADHRRREQEAERQKHRR